MDDKRLTVLYEQKPCYDIVFSQSFNSLKQELIRINCTQKKVCIVSDSNVSSIYSEEIIEMIASICKETHIFTFKAGENSKTLDTVKSLYQYLIENNYQRKDILIALGGGVTGDLCGFCAATYLRGIEFIQIPTSLLAQSDSSIGGKTGVDFDGYKNMVGAFKMPILTYINSSCLKTLDDRQFFAGFAEIMKSALIKDENFYMWLIDHLYEICEKDEDILQAMIIRTCEIKKAVVEIDPLEQNERAFLNLGHTIGHAIEKYKNFELLHGECVALGCVCAAYISSKKGYLSNDEYLEIRDMFVPFNLPISIEDINIKEIVRLTYSDKKVEEGKRRFILLKQIGEAIIDTTVTDQEIEEALKEINYSEEDANE